MWLSTALTATLAGNLTLVGSVANIIVVDTAQKVLSPAGAGDRQGPFKVGFWEFLRYGAAVTAATTALALLLLYLERRIGLI